ncbi:MAG: endonuclease III [Rickettsiales bacterium]|nr:endonuclease III [Rickettsiales bacterium]
MQQDKINKIFEIFAKNNPNPKTELIANNEFTLLVAIVLSAQATDKGVNKATEKLFKIADSAEKIYALGEENLKTYIKTIGLYNSKAKNIIALSKKLIDMNNVIPNDLTELQKLPGVGRKTANVFLNCARKQPLIGVDTHVERVSNRIGIINAKNTLETEKKLTKKIPNQWKLHAHHWLILHGRYICKARKPECSNCMIIDLCKYKKKTC